MGRAVGEAIRGRRGASFGLAVFLDSEGAEAGGEGTWFDAEEGGGAGGAGGTGGNNGATGIVSNIATV